MQGPSGEQWETRQTRKRGSVAFSYYSFWGRLVDQVLAKATVKFALADTYQTAERSLGNAQSGVPQPSEVRHQIAQLPSTAEANYTKQQREARW